MRKKMSDRIHKVTITGYVIQKDYMDTPDLWDSFDPHLLDIFIEYPELEFTEMVEENNGNTKLAEKSN